LFSKGSHLINIIKSLTKIIKIIQKINLDNNNKKKLNKEEIFKEANLMIMKELNSLNHYIMMISKSNLIKYWVMMK